jgi:hypothetical protein
VKKDAALSSGSFVTQQTTQLVTQCCCSTSVSEIQSAFDVCPAGRWGKNRGACCLYCYVTGIVRRVYVIDGELGFEQRVLELPVSSVQLPSCSYKLSQYAVDNFKATTVLKLTTRAKIELSLNTKQHNRDVKKTKLVNSSSESVALCTQSTLFRYLIYHCDN